jgi:FO synthase
MYSCPCPTLHPLPLPLQVFLPLTRLCRDACGYCTFARPPAPGQRAYMTLPEVVEVAALGAAAGCTEALFTLGEWLWEQGRGSVFTGVGVEVGGAV